MTNFGGPRYGSRRVNGLRGAQLAPVRSATGAHLIKTTATAAGQVRASCACGWTAKTVRSDYSLALADGARHIGRKRVGS